jgi:serine/threonine-protein kinase
VIARARGVQDSAGPGCVVIKLVSNRTSNGSLASALLARETAVAAHASHPHLSCILAADLAGSRPYVVLPYFEGANLRRLLQRPLALDTSLVRDDWSVQFALSIVRQVASALHALHARGWVHGQIRPEHIIRSPQGHATLIDLARCRQLRTAECQASSSGAILPTYLAPAYAAPECFQQRGIVGTASDIYSLGIVLFELLTGRLPFIAETSDEYARCHRQTRPPPLAGCCATVSHDIEELVHRLLAKEPLRRPTAEQLRDWLAYLEIEELGRLS